MSVVLCYALPSVLCYALTVPAVRALPMAAALHRVLLANRGAMRCVLCSMPPVHVHLFALPTCPPRCC